MIRVLIADDSSTTRGLIAAIFGTDPMIEVVGEAADGAEAVALTTRLRPDLVTMDIRMPRMDGFAATKEIMITSPTPIVIVTASREALDVRHTMQALEAGALTVLQKPPGPEAPGFGLAATTLIQTVKAMAQVKVVRHHRPAERLERGRPTARDAGLGRGRIVAVATSTGGPAALSQILSNLPPQFPLPIAVVQHISAGFTSGLATWLHSICPLQVRVAAAGEPLTPGTVLVAPENLHMGVSSRGTVLLSDLPAIDGFRPSATYLFESVARAFGSSTVAVILTGMGRDGVAGLRAVRQAGGVIIAQDENSSVVFGMPREAIAAGLADLVLPIDAISQRLIRCVEAAG